MHIAILTVTHFAIIINIGGDKMKNNIKIAREKSGKTQKECSDALGISLRAWQGYEQGIREPKFELLCRIADLFNVTTDYLLGREPEPNPFADMNLDEDDEKEVIAKYMSMPPEVRAMMLDVLLQLADAARNRQAENEKIQQNTSKSSLTHIGRKDDDEYITYTTTIGAEMDRRKAYEAMQRAGELDNTETKKSVG